MKPDRREINVEEITRRKYVDVNVSQEGWLVQTIGRMHSLESNGKTVIRQTTTHAQRTAHTVKSCVAALNIMQ